MNRGLGELRPYPFERLAALRAEIEPAAEFEAINLSIGEPQHPTPRLIHEALLENLAGTARYPATRGIDALRETVVAWLTRRFALPSGALDPARQVLPVNGTREALFAIAQCLVRQGTGAIVAMPNPFYQIYEGAALLSDAQPYYLPCPAADGFMPDFSAVPDAVWRRCQLVYTCSPGNPSGRSIDAGGYERLFELADRHDFVIVADECYCELYAREDCPPPGLLQIAAAAGRDDFRRCIVVHSLSKRSNAPGLRSGFVAGDASVIEAFYKYRTYHGCAMPLHVQHASIAAWRDEAHVVENRRLYRAKFDAVVPLLADLLSLSRPEAGFYLWPTLPIDDVEFVRRLISQANVTTLPGRFIARDADGHNPGMGRLRMALVANLDDCIEAANRMRSVLLRL